MLGYYNYTVWLTYLSLLSSLVGLGLASEGIISGAVICLALSGLFDAFDGKVARTKKNRTETEKKYGIQIDSLADVVCFGVLPAFIGFRSGLRGPAVILLLWFALAGLIRLAFFNVAEEERQKTTAENRKYYQGVPITSSSVILPLWYILTVLFPALPFEKGLYVLFPVLGTLFVLPVKVKKPSLKALIAMIVLVGGGVVFAVIKLLQG